MPLNDHPLIDARGLKCPLPVLKLEKFLDTCIDHQSVQVILLTDDPIAKIDIPLACKKLGCTHQAKEKDGALEFTIARQQNAS